jgi:hypothetical protein
MSSPLYFFFKVKYSLPEASHQRHLVSDNKNDECEHRQLYKKKLSEIYSSGILLCYLNQESYNGLGMYLKWQKHTIQMK